MTNKEAMKLALEALEDLGMKHFESTGEVLHKEVFDVLKEALAKQEQGEPVGVAHSMQEGFTHCIWSEAVVPVGTKFYTTPQQRTWVGLSEDEITQEVGDTKSLRDVVKNIEYKLMRKNT